MRIGLYCRDLVSLGGGNKHSLAIVEHLSRKHDVDIITHTPYGASQIPKRLNFELDHVYLRSIPYQSDAEMGKLSGEYDLFINHLHNIFVPCQARYGILFVLFPVQLNLDLRGKIRRFVARQLVKHLFVFDFQSGFYGEEYRNQQRIRLLSDSAQIRLKPSFWGYTVQFTLRNPSALPCKLTISLDQQIIHEISLPGGATSQPCSVPVPARRSWHAHPFTLTIDGAPGPDRVLVDDAARHGSNQVELGAFQVSHPTFRIYEQIFEQWIPQWRDRLLNVPTDQALDRVKTYDLIWANSEYTRRWINAYWQQDSTVLYPLIHVEEFQPLPKKRQILSVGRFFVGGHNKKHLLMIEAFKSLCDQGITGWALHLAGGVVDDPIHLEYLTAVKSATQGYPIFVHENIPFADLKVLYGESSIYWHAAGFGEDEALNPVRFEHFGMTTVEAMAAGGVPVVIGKGGQPEIIQHGDNGFLWQTVGELQEYTKRLVEDDALRQKMAQAAAISSRTFDRKHFEDRVDETLKMLGIPG